MSKSASTIYQPKAQIKGLSFDPRIKILLLAELDILLFMGHTLPYETCVFLFCALLLLIGGQSRSAIRFAVIFTLFAAIQRLINPYLARSFFSLIYFFVVVVRKVLPAFMLAKWIVATTEVSAFVAAMWKIKLPKEAIVTMSVIFRCFPTISEEWSAIQTAMKMRGIEFSLKNMATKPIQTAEHVLVPLFISVLNISDELAAAALCRGLDNPDTHTCVTAVRFRWYDILFLAIASLWLIMMSVLAIRGYSL